MKAILSDRLQANLSETGGNCRGYDESMSFAKRLREIMEFRGVSQVDLANQLGLTSQSVTQWVSIKKSTAPRNERLAEIAKYLDVVPGDLLAPVGAPITDLSGATTQLHTRDDIAKNKFEVLLLAMWREMFESERRVMLELVRTYIANRQVPDADDVRHG